MDVHNGVTWIKAVMVDTLDDIVYSKRIIIILIFNRFRFFFGNKATHSIPRAYYYGMKQNYYFHKQVVKHLKFHLHNNRDAENAPPFFWLTKKK